MQTRRQLVAFVRENYAAIMNADRNPLRVLPLALRFQTMVYLSVMWTTIFCTAFSGWYWYGELIVGHVLFVLGIALTTVTFARAGGEVGVPQEIKR